MTRKSTIRHRYFRKSFFLSFYFLPVPVCRSEAQSGRNGLRIAGLTGIRIEGNVITLPERGVSEMLPATGPIVLSVIGSKISICPVTGLSESLPKTVYETVLIYTTTTKTKAPNNILALKPNSSSSISASSHPKHSIQTQSNFNMALYRAVQMLPCTSRNAERVWRETDEKTTISPFHKTLITYPYILKTDNPFMIKILRIISYHFYVLKIIIHYNVFDRVLSN